jgi:hypothetical protein
MSTGHVLLLEAERELPPAFLSAARPIWPADTG